jgi:predicted HicB family RNase H-like nuclease
VSKRKVGFWIEQELYERMVKAAEADRRSFSNWLSVTIERAVEDASREPAEQTAVA